MAIFVAVVLVALISVGSFFFARQKERAEVQQKFEADQSEFLAQLKEAGFFDGLSDANELEVRNSIMELGWPGVFSHPTRCHHADAENLAEGGVAKFIAEIAPFLRSAGVDVPSVSDQHEMDRASVVIGGVEHVLYSTEELSRNNQDAIGLIWGLSTARTFTIVNQWLQKAGSKERFYAVNGGNDLSGFFLTEEMHRIIMAHQAADANDGPYMPNEQYPWFGQPPSKP